MCARASETQRVRMDTKRETVGESFQYSLFLLSFLLSFPSMLEQCMKLPCIPHQDYRRLDDEHIKGSSSCVWWWNRWSTCDDGTGLEQLHGIDELPPQGLARSFRWVPVDFRGRQSSLSRHVLVGELRCCSCMFHLVKLLDIPIKALPCLRLRIDLIHCT